MFLMNQLNHILTLSDDFKQWLGRILNLLLLLLLVFGLSNQGNIIYWIIGLPSSLFWIIFMLFCFYGFVSNKILENLTNWYSNTIKKSKYGLIILYLILVVVIILSFFVLISILTILRASSVIDLSNIDIYSALMIVIIISIFIQFLDLFDIGFKNALNKLKKIESKKNEQIKNID